MLFLMHIQYSDPEREPSIEAADVISSIATEDSAVYAHIPLLGWVLSGSESQILTWSWRTHVFFLFPHSKQETEKYNLLRSLQALLDALKKKKSVLFLRCSFQGT